MTPLIRFTAGPAIAIAVAAGAFAAGAPAGAAPAATCAGSGNTICLTENSNASGQIWRQTPSQITGCRSLVPDGFNDKASFLLNNTSGLILRVFEHHDCSGQQEVVYAGGSMSLAGKSFNDKASSIQVH